MKIECECYDRVVGYYRPVKQCNKGKQAEISDRLRWSKYEDIFQRVKNQADVKEVSSIGGGVLCILSDR